MPSTVRLTQLFELVGRCGLREELAHDRSPTSNDTTRIKLIRTREDRDGILRAVNPHSPSGWIDNQHDGRALIKPQLYFLLE